ncbi:MAG: UbiA family prenyltransferase, partial [Streptococcaceae bacterium]|nr:UbiA family prenyltransferase [Streptococcaceae bacterium]
FIHFIRIQTLPAALLSPLVGILYSIWYFKSFHLIPTLLFIIGLISINFFVSAWNNLMDYYKALDPEYKNEENIIATHKIRPRLAITICLIFLILDLIVGVRVLLLTNWAILPLGAFCFFVAVFYTFGPFAFSRFPLGEILAGLCEGFLGFFLAVYINSFDKGYFFIEFKGWKMNWTWDFALLIPLSIVGIICFCQNFNVMFSDNICDLEQDIKNGRYTLPYYLKKSLSLKLYRIVYILAILMILLAVACHILPLWSLISLLILPFVWSNMKKFLQQQVKSQTFKYQIDNLILFNASTALSLLLALLFK